MTFFAAKRLSALLRGIAAKHDSVYCLNCLHSFRTENELRYHEKVCKNNAFCGFLIPSERDNILELNQYMMSDKMPYIVYVDIESLIKKIDGCADNPENSSTTKKDEHIPHKCSMSAISELVQIENKRCLYRGKECMKVL